MPRLVECVPNFSEGRDRAVVDALAAAIESVAGVTLLDVELDADHHRSVLTFVADPEAALEAAFRATKLASERIDLRRHKGQHPRMGAVDVIPFVPIEGLTLEECVELARRLGKRVGEELHIPVFLYEAAATRPDRENLAEVRRGEFEGLTERIGRDPERVPDFGPSKIHESAGAVAIGARRPLVAFNANLATADVAVAKAIAKAIRFADGGLRYVKALGFAIREGRQAQVSMNLVNTDGTPIHRVLALIDSEARRRGTYVTGCEVVGLVPQAALLDASEHALRLENFRRDQVLEIRMRRPPAGGGVSVGDFLDRVSEATPTPGGGSVAALAGALGATLVHMVAGLTVGKKKYAEVDDEMKRIRVEARSLQEHLAALVRRDSEAFEAVLAASRLPKASPEEARTREEALQKATWAAARVPLETAQRAAEVAVLAARAAVIGNPNAATDAGSAAWMARAAGESALLNVQVNLQSLGESADKQSVEKEARGLAARLATATDAASAAVNARLTSTA
ncbi:MAG TPA: glutamate formimidoyltransferase [Candidatus Eisenbacteria bacterium]|nr:glutamate formimidoyltransferase [Candidatus Eisenbacteria bacterium]